MAKPKKAPSDRPPVYVAQRPDPEELKKRGEAFAHPRIQVGHRYGDGDDGQTYFFEEFAVDFQVSLQADSAGELTNGGHAYGGTLVDLRLDDALAAVKVVQRVQAKALLLAPGQPDEYFRFIVGLRGTGFREAVMKQGEYPRIAFLR